MRIEIYIILIIGAMVYDIYHEHKYSKMLLTYKKYYKIVGVISIGLFIYFIAKKNPKHLFNIVSSANMCMKYIPVDKETKNMVMPILDLTSNNEPFIKRYMNSDINEESDENPPKQIMKRVVSETKKKYVASQNDWKCSGCGISLPYYYEVDHIIALKDGGTNDVSNLTAMCVNCHKQKTLSNFL